MSPREELWSLVRAEIDAAGLSQAAVARRLGLSNKHLNQMMTGRARLPIFWAEKILRLCGRELIFGTAPLTSEEET